MYGSEIDYLYQAKLAPLLSVFYILASVLTARTVVDRKAVKGPTDQILKPNGHPTDNQKTPCPFSCFEQFPHSSKS
jgi:hypothetical protein